MRECWQTRGRMSRTSLGVACTAVVALSAGPVNGSNPAPPAAPRIDAVTPLVKLSTAAEICVCGRFPTRESAEALRVDGRPLIVTGPVREEVVTLRLPPGLAPGPHTVSGASEAGYDPEDQAEVRIVEINTKVCEPLPFGPRRRIHFMIAGTADPVKLWIRNETPGLVTLAGGPLLELTTSGGRRNQVIVNAKVTGLPGRWTLTAELDAPSCPCAPGGEIDGEPASDQNFSRELSRSVSEVEARFHELEPELRVAARRGTLAHAVLQVLDELERRLVEATSRPELAALRAWIEDWLAAERGRWRSVPGEAGPRALPSPTLTFVRYPSALAPQESEAESDVESFIDRVFGLFRKLDEVSENLYADLCVRFDPKEGTGPPKEGLLWLYPKRYPATRRTANPDAIVPTLTRGLYCVLLTEPQLEDDEFQWLAAVGSCRNTMEPDPESKIEQKAAKAVWARGEADLVREVNHYLTCREESQTCLKRLMPLRFTCDRSRE